MFRSYWSKAVPLRACRASRPQRRTTMNPTQPFPNGRSTASQASHSPKQSTTDASIPPTPPPVAAAAQATPTEQAGRDSRGRFCRGNPGGPGNPFARKTAALRQALLDTVTVEDLQAIVRQLLHKAKDGDVSAARLVLSYTIGKPDRAVDPDALDRHEWEQFQQDRVHPDDLAAVAGGMQAPLACTLLRAALPEVQNRMAHDLGQMFQDSLTEPAPAPADRDAEPDPDEDKDLREDAAPVAAEPHSPQRSKGPQRHRGPGPNRNERPTGPRPARFSGPWLVATIASSWLRRMPPGSPTSRRSWTTTVPIRTTARTLLGICDRSHRKRPARDSPPSPNGCKTERRQRRRMAASPGVSAPGVPGNASALIPIGERWPFTLYRCPAG